jgi:hypothetical protein
MLGDAAFKSAYNAGGVLRPEDAIALARFGPAPIAFPVSLE